MFGQKIFENNLFDYTHIPEPNSSDPDVKDPDIIKNQEHAIKKSSSRYFNEKPVRPIRTVFRNLPEALGMELENGYKRYIIYDPKIRDSSELKQKVPTEEAIHLQQKGKGVLASLVLVYDLGFMKYIVPIGRILEGILYEGGIRPIAKKCDLPKPDAYPEDWYKIAEEIDQVIPLKVWYDTAQRDLEYSGKADRVLDLLKNQKIKNIIEGYIIRPKSGSRPPNMYV